MREVSVVVKLISNDGVTSSLHQIKIGSGDQITCSQEMLHLFTNGNLGVNQLLHIGRVS